MTRRTGQKMNGRRTAASRRGLIGEAGGGARAVADNTHDRAFQVAIGVVAALSRIERAHTRQQLLRASGLSRPAIGLRERIRGRGTLGIQCHRLLQLRERTGHIIPLQQQLSELGPRARQARIEANRRFERMHGFERRLAAGSMPDRISATPSMWWMAAVAPVRRARARSISTARAVWPVCIQAMASATYGTALSGASWRARSNSVSACSMSPSSPAARRAADEAGRSRVDTQADVDDLETQGKVLVIQTEQRKIAVIAFRRWIQPDRLTQGIVGVLNPARPDIRTCRQVVELGRAGPLPQQLLDDPDGRIGSAASTSINASLYPAAYESV